MRDLFLLFWYSAAKKRREASPRWREKRLWRVWRYDKKNRTCRTCMNVLLSTTEYVVVFDFGKCDSMKFPYEFA